MEVVQKSTKEVLLNQLNEFTWKWKIIYKTPGKKYLANVNSPNKHVNGESLVTEDFMQEMYIFKNWWY